MNAGGRPGKTEERETMAETLKDLLAPHPAEWPAIGAPGRPWMTYGGLRDLSADVAGHVFALLRIQDLHFLQGILLRVVYYSYQIWLINVIPGMIR